MQTLSEILAPTRVACHVPPVSKKRLFETMAQLICDDQTQLEYNHVLDKLVERESLGSTGLGSGIALPHCRVGNCSEPLGSLFTLAEPIEFDAPDEQPVDVLFVLLVPEEAHQQHLDILAEAAGLFSNEAAREQLRAADDATALYSAVRELTA
jgi:PTS system nitrogen regulatory IIA component